MPDSLRLGLILAIEKSGFPLYIHGPAGTGKTCVAALLYQRWQGKAVWKSCRQLLLDLAAWRADPERQMEWLMPSGEIFRRPASNGWEDLTSANWLVCLDDLGTRELSPTQSEILMDLLDARQGMPLIVTGNHDRDELSKIMDGRIVSRLFRGTVVKLGGNDLRQPKQKFEVSNG